MSEKNYSTPAGTLPHYWGNQPGQQRVVVVVQETPVSEAEIERREAGKLLAEKFRRKRQR